MARPKKEVSKLTELGQLGKSVLKRALTDIDNDYKDAAKANPKRELKYSLTDLMKVIDRVQKFEFIELKLKEVDDEEGFFGKPEGAEDE